VNKQAFLAGYLSKEAGWGSIIKRSANPNKAVKTILRNRSKVLEGNTARLDKLVGRLSQASSPNAKGYLNRQIQKVKGESKAVKTSSENPLDVIHSAHGNKAGIEVPHPTKDGRAILNEYIKGGDRGLSTTLPPSVNMPAVRHGKAGRQQATKAMQDMGLREDSLGRIIEAVPADMPLPEGYLHRYPTKGNIKGGGKTLRYSKEQNYERGTNQGSLRSADKASRKLGGDRNPESFFETMLDKRHTMSESQGYGLLKPDKAYRTAAPSEVATDLSTLTEAPRSYMWRGTAAPPAYLGGAADGHIIDETFVSGLPQEARRYARGNRLKEIDSRGPGEAYQWYMSPYLGVRHNASIWKGGKGVENSAPVRSLSSNNTVNPRLSALDPQDLTRYRKGVDTAEAIQNKAQSAQKSMISSLFEALSRSYSKNR
jgi:hypothetical protein